MKYYKDVWIARGFTKSDVLYFMMVFKTRKAAREAVKKEKSFYLVPTLRYEIDQWAVNS